MKRIVLSTLSLAAMAAAGTAHAQSSVTLYGVIDTSIQYANSVAETHNGVTTGASQIAMGGGNMQGSRWGLKGAEDLGGGLKAIFQLENGFHVGDGTLGQGNRLFGRTAMVGLSADQYGTLTLGRQMDTTTDLVQPLTADGYFGAMFATPGDVDNNDNTAIFNNVVKYTSPLLDGFQFAGMYALGGVAGSTGSGQTWGAAGTYAIGSFSVAAGYLKQDNTASTVARVTADSDGWNSTTSDGTFAAADSNINGRYASARSIGIAQVAAQYVAGPFTVSARYSNAQYKSDAMSGFATSQRYNTAAAFLGYQLNPALLLGLGYTWTHGSGDSSNTYHQISVGADYNLSKRTDLYALAAYQHASGELPGEAGVSARAAIGSYGLNSASASQTLVNLGIRHKF
jgi:predicted porin